MGLILFGAHLLLISWLAWKTIEVPNWIAVFVSITGVGYVIDSIGSLSSDSYSADITTITFVGEVILMFWLLIKGRSVNAVLLHKQARSHLKRAPWFRNASLAWEHNGLDSIA